MTRNRQVLMLAAAQDRDSYLSGIRAASHEAEGGHAGVVSSLTCFHCCTVVLGNRFVHRSPQMQDQSLGMLFMGTLVISILLYLSTTIVYPLLYLIHTTTLPGISGGDELSGGSQAEHGGQEGSRGGCQVERGG